MIQNLVVIETASVLAGPLVGQFFAELGARVIKVENGTTHGDVTRSWRTSGEDSGNDISAYFACANFGKESVSVDLRDKQDVALLRSMLQRADVFIHNWRPGDAEKFGFTYDQCRSINERLIYASISGYGQESMRVGYDAIIQAESGLMSMNGPQNGEPTKMPVAMVDIMAAHQLKQGILVSLLERESTGKGSSVHVSLMESALSSLVNQGTNYLRTGGIPGREGSEHPNIVPYGTVFSTMDGCQVLLAVGTDSQYRDLCAVLGIDVHPGHATNHGRVKDRQTVVRTLHQAIGAVDSASFLSECATRKIPAGRVETVDRALNGPLAATVLLASDDLRGLRSAVFHSSAVPAGAALLPPPHLNEHGDRIRQEFGQT